MYLLSTISLPVQGYTKYSLVYVNLTYSDNNVKLFILNNLVLSMLDLHFLFWFDINTRQSFFLK